MYNKLCLYSNIFGQIFMFMSFGFKHELPTSMEENIYSTDKANKAIVHSNHTANCFISSLYAYKFYE